MGGIEIPQTRADNIILQLKGSSRDIFNRIGVSRIEGKSLDRRYRPDEKVEQVEAVRTQIEKKSSACDAAIEPPRRSAQARRKATAHMNMHGCQATDSIRMNQIANFQKAGKRAAIIRNPKWHAGLAKSLHHANTFSMIHRHWLFNQTRLAGRSHFQSQLAVARRRCRDINGVDVRIIDQVIRCRVHARLDWRFRTLRRRRNCSTHAPRTAARHGITRRWSGRSRCSPTTKSRRRPDRGTSRETIGRTEIDRHFMPRRPAPLRNAARPFASNRNAPKKSARV